MLRKCFIIIIIIIIIITITIIIIIKQCQFPKSIPRLQIKNYKRHKISEALVWCNSCMAL